MDRELTLSELTQLTNVTPRNAGLFLADFLTRKSLSENQAAQTLGCAASTVNRLVKGGDLTADMAAKIHRAFGLSIKMLFNLEADYKTYQAEEKLKGHQAA
ncbi:helix-turn-helix domain-containing protein [Rheinheimera texasensis]|uniref:helix-turn-helix transcriptional regulator n=1 Tax=Rheinheimera texasensis TaxID=306205 RepID=UPI0032B23178